MPPQPSRHRVTPSHSEDGSLNEEEKNVESSGQSNVQNDTPDSQPQSRYQLRPRGDVDYAMTAIPDVVTTSDEPSVAEALRSAEKENWIVAMEEELVALVKNKTWTVGERPPISAKILPSMVILKLKRDENGKPARFKGRVVALGNHQTGFDVLSDLYAPVICIELVRTLLIVAQAKGWSTRHIDFKGAFLNAKLEKGSNIWVRLPSIPGTSFNGQLVKLRKSLYGLRQAPKLWYKMLSKELQKLGFKCSTASDCLYMLLSSDSIVLLIYVDDVLVMGSDDAIDQLVRKLSTVFDITDLGRPTHFLGIKFEFREDGVFLSQSAYIDKIIDISNMTTAKPIQHPLPLSHTLYEKITDPTPEEQATMETVPFRKVLGSLLYLSTRTRPDISTAVSMIAKFQSKPRHCHWKMVKNVVRYLIGTKKHGILLPKVVETPKLLCWSDADWARDLTNRRSRSGILITLNGGPVVWTSRLQSYTAESSTEAEFNALSVALREVKWLRVVLSELQLLDGSPTVIKQDNLGSIKWTEEPNGLRKVKHVEIKYHVVKDAVLSKVVSVDYTPSANNRSDSLTKVLIGADFIKHRDWIGVTV